MQKLIIILLLITFVFGLKVLEHQCGHDKFRENYKYESIPQDPVEESSDIQTDMRFKQSSGKCGLVTIPNIDKTQGKNSDLHLYISYTVERGKNTLAHAGWCQFIDNLGPTHGTVNFNIGLLATKNLHDPIEFEDLMEIVIHEMTHILGFSDDDVPKWINSKGKPHTVPIVKYVTRGVQRMFLRTPHVLAFAKKYYACETLLGMPLENQGGSGSAGSHWEKTAIADEYMNASRSFTQAHFSGFTTNLLRDTGFYAEVNASMEEKTTYGQGKGCQFITGQCDQKLREFCTPVQDDGLCDFYHYGSSGCSVGEYNDPDCYTSIIYDNVKCWDTKRNKKVVCTQNLAKMKVNGFNGYIQCPENIQEFCEFKKFCPNFCSANGFCLKGLCYCAKGYYGQDCSNYKSS
ncbi:leishmanolysin family protein, putative [Ichthyophthirius multifiliis]|uniref:Leishmanolysin family protein, putative n=1 Tax=Ichthyophthirius multifiliis TaxID=5932 RepID=G0QJX2_ICHMU|nr:leishmanolysin family protein, putative [Ichthyophthirius multifiliis]EGR34483.1 leishmanolysin family protein, putative [Ichthyophthirius multifiliis]|eukprot:XP_004039787.1 leishmanolysin family protein, putative [Ichthyophthirius multifiliis]